MATEKVVSEIELLFRTQNADGAIASTERFTKAQESAARSLNTVARAHDENYKLTQEIVRQERLLERARAQGLEKTTAYAAAVERLDAMHRRLNGAMNDNAKATGLARHELINLGRQAQDVAVSLAGGQSPLTVLAQQGSQVFDVLSSSKAGVGGALKSLGENLLGLVTPGRVATGGLLAGFAALEYGISRAQSALADLGRAQETSGVGASRVLAARGVGAGVGLDSKGVQGALDQANQQFEKFKLGSGEVRSALEKIDGRFVLLGERAKTTGEFIEFVGEKIRELSREEGLDLAKRLFGDDAGAKFYESLRNGELAMKALDEAAQKTGVSFADGPAKAALDMQREIERAAELSDQKLFAAFGRLSSPLQGVSLLWQEIKGGIADAAIAATEFYNAIRDGGKMAGPVAGAQGRSIDQYMADNNLNGPGLPEWRPGSVGMPGVPVGMGATQRAFTAWNNDGLGPMERKKKRGSGRHAKTDEERAADNYANVTRDLEHQLSLAQAIGDANDAVALKVKIENEQHKIGVAATKEQKDNVAALVTKIDEAEKAQKKLNEQAKAFNEAYSSVAGSLSGGFKEILKGGKPGDVLKKGLDFAGDNILDAALTGSGPFAKIMGTEGKDGAVGGIFGEIVKALHLGAERKTQTMNVQAASVNVVGGDGLGDIGSGMGKAVSGAADFFSKLLPFADGGVMTSRGALPLNRYAGGGVANKPQLALFGEGAGPEAFVPLPDGRSIPVSMQGGPQSGGNVYISNYSGADVQAEQKPNGDWEIMIDRKIAENNARLPSMMRDHMRREV
ncbi:phage tail length tape measure family protein [Methylocystis echinoides]|uniref:phage tail length tape measure family protein n=1 Tax=Methylocystis echinoides TaxID=29468 RepID=UPI003447EE11